jgi:hypothetical protein
MPNDHRRANLRPFLCRHVQLAVVVAVTPVGMMQMAFHQVIHMIAVRHSLMTTGWTVHVVSLMRAAVVLRRALILIRGSNRHGVFIDMVLMDVVQVSLVQIVGMAVMLDRRMAAIRAMDVGVIFMFGTA